MKCFYADIVRAGRVALLAGPFASEPEAREWAEPASRLAAELDPRAHFDPFGVVALDNQFRPGVLNARLGIPADRLLKAA